MSDIQAPTTVEAFKDDPVSAGPGAESTPAPAASEPVEAFKDDPVGPEVTYGSAGGLPVEQKVADDEVKITAEPITKGILGYKAPGLVSQLRFSKKYFWLGDEAVPAKDLGAYLRGEKPDVAHPNAAWSSQTGKGLLYFAKRSEDTKAPAGLINLADVSEVAKEGATDFSFKLYNHKHTFQAKSGEERAGWLVAIEKEAQNATEAREGITTSDAYKETLAQLKKPGAAAAAAAGSTRAISSERKKSTDGAAAATDEKKTTQKSRSASRGKRASVFGSMLGKKEEQDKKDEPTAEAADKKDEAEATKTEEPQNESSAVPVAAAAGTAGVGAIGAAAIVNNADDKDVKEVKDEPAATEAKDESPKGTAATSKANKRGSIFGGLFQKSDKKEETPAAKEEAVEPKTETTETPAAAAATTEPATLDTTAAEESKTSEPTSAVTPSKANDEKRRSSFFGFGSTKKDKKEPNNTTDSEPPATTAEEPPATVASEPPATAPAEPVITTTPEKEKKEASKTDKRQSSSKFSEIFRRPSQALKGKKDKKEPTAPATVAETTETPAITDEKPNMNGAAAVNPIMGETTTTEDKPSEPKTLGDVVPEAVSVGEAPQVSKTVEATA